MEVEQVGGFHLLLEPAASAEEPGLPGRSTEETGTQISACYGDKDPVD